MIDMTMKYLKACSLLALEGAIAGILVTAVYAAIASVYAIRGITECLRWINRKVQVGAKS